MPLTVNHAKNVTVADFTGTVTVFNSAGATTTALATDLARPSDWNSAHNITFTPAASEIQGLFAATSGISKTTDANGITFGQPAIGFFEPFPLPNTNSTIGTVLSGLWHVDPLVLPAPISNGLFHYPVVCGASTACFQDGAVWSATQAGSITRYHTQVDGVAIYKRGSGASTSRLESIWSNQVSWFATWQKVHSGSTTSNATLSEYLTISIPVSFDTAGGVTYTSNTGSGTVSYAASTGASTLGSSLITGPMRFVSGSRQNIIPMASTIQPGDYYIAHAYYSSSSVQTASGNGYSGGTNMPGQSNLCFLENNQVAYKRMGFSTTNQTSCVPNWHGIMSTSTVSASSVINTSDMRTHNMRKYWFFHQTTY